MKHLILLSLFSAMTMMASAQDVATAAEYPESSAPVLQQAGSRQNPPPLVIPFRLPQLYVGAETHARLHGGPTQP